MIRAYLEPGGIFGPAEQRRWLEDFAREGWVIDRQDGIQRRFDQLAIECLRQDEPTMGICVCWMSVLRALGRHGEVLAWMVATPWTWNIVVRYAGAGGEFGAAAMRRLLEALDGSEAVHRRTEGLQRDFARLAVDCLHEGELAMGVGLVLLSILRAAHRHGAALEVMLAIMIEIQGRGDRGWEGV